MISCSLVIAQEGKVGTALNEEAETMNLPSLGGQGWILVYISRGFTRNLMLEFLYDGRQIVKKNVTVRRVEIFAI